MKKIVLGLFILLSSFTLLFLGVKTKALSAPTMVTGASIRTTGDHQGLKFSATVDSLEGVSEHGFYVALGTHTQSAMATAAGADATGVDGKKLKKVEVTGSDTTFHAVIYNIPEASYGQVITAIAYVSDGSTKTFSTEVMTRNIADIARTAYNESSTPAEIVATVAEAMKVKVTHSDSSIDYYSSLSSAISATFADGDTVDLVKGTYSDSLTISVDNFTLNGAGKDIALTTAGKRSDNREETVLSNTITTSDGISGLTINGLKFTGSYVINLEESQSNIVLKYNNCVYTSNQGIKDHAADYNTAIHTNITVSNNYFKCLNGSYNRDVYLQSAIKNLEVTDNYFGSTATTLYDSGYVIKCNRIATDSVINIKNNLFRNYNANYLIDLGYVSNSVSYVNIENNEMSSSYTKCLVGSGIRVVNLKTDGVVSIIHNTKFRTSPYFNAIMLSCGTAANDTSSQYPFVDIRFNKFYVEECAVADETKPEDRNTVTSRYTRIGLGVPADLGSKLVLGYNYYGSSTSGYAYTSNSSASASKNTNTTSLKNNEATSDEADSYYTTYATELNSFISDLETYLDEMGTLGSGIDAYYGGSDANDIATYISSFNASYGDIYQIKAGELTFISGSVTDACDLFILAKYNIDEADSIKP